MLHVKSSEQQSFSGQRQSVRLMHVAMVIGDGSCILEIPAHAQYAQGNSETGARAHLRRLTGHLIGCACACARACAHRMPNRICTISKTVARTSKM